MSRRLSDQELHELYCPLKNAKSALFLVASFSIVAFVSWKGLHKPLGHRSLVELLFAILVAAMLAKVLAAFTCFRERLAVGAIIVSLVIGVVAGFVPAAFSKHAEMVKSGKLALSLLGLLVSLTMLVQSARNPSVDTSNAGTSIGWKPKQIPILAVAALTLLVLGALLYFLPFRQ